MQVHVAISHIAVSHVAVSQIAVSIVAVSHVAVSHIAVSYVAASYVGNGDVGNGHVRGHAKKLIEAVQAKPILYQADGKSYTQTLRRKISRGKKCG